MFYLMTSKFKVGQRIIQYREYGVHLDDFYGLRLVSLNKHRRTPMVIKMVDKLNGIYYVRDTERGDHGLDKLIPFNEIHNLYELAPSGWRISYGGK